jgi:hypothetical protein
MDACAFKSGVVWNLRCMIPRYLCPY